MHSPESAVAVPLAAEEMAFQGIALPYCQCSKREAFAQRGVHRCMTCLNTASRCWVDKVAELLR